MAVYLKGTSLWFQRSGCQNIVEVVENNAKIREIPVDHRSYPSVLAKLKDADKVMTKQEDTCIRFIQSMQTDKVASFDVHDQALVSQDVGQLVDCIIIDVHIGRIPISQLCSWSTAIISRRQ